MTRIEKFEVKGLAGRLEPVTAELSPDVNVFFGLNGSGKTSLLKILHSALRGSVGTLARVPFSSASVSFYSHAADRVITRTLDGPVTAAEQLEVTHFDEVAGVAVPLMVDLARGKKWRSKPSLEGPYQVTLLTVSRLTDGSVPTPRYRAGRLEDDAGGLDEMFANHVRGLWRLYTNRALSEVRQIQQAGLAEIMQTLFRAENRAQKQRALDTATAYARANDFLARQGIANGTGSLKSFSTRYESDARLGSVVDDIDRIEREIEKVEQPRRRLEQLVRDFVSSDKQIEFSDQDIVVRVGEQNIPLTALSSGEKHLLRIMVSVIDAENTTVIIDEPELSMHIDWQHDLLTALRTVNPHAQIIVATHSPEIMAEVPDSKIFRL